MRTLLTLFSFCILYSLSAGNSTNEEYAPQTCGHITSFSINGVSLHDGDELCLSDLSSTFQLEAHVSGGGESLQFQISGAANSSNTENYEPYNSETLTTKVGTYHVTAKLYKNNHLGGALCDTDNLSFTIIDCSSTVDCTAKTLVFYDMDACTSFSSNGSNQDFSEFTPSFPNSGDCVNVTASNLFNQVNGHSCVEGANGSIAGICIRGDHDDHFDSDDDDALRFSITVSPSTVGKLTELSFFQLSPTHFQHLSGGSGSNNFLRRFGVRILKDGHEVFKKTDLHTNQHEWEFESFDLSNDPDFDITQTTTFDFEITGYDPDSNDDDDDDDNSGKRFFDVDEIKIKGCCVVVDPCAGLGGIAMAMESVMWMIVSLIIRIVQQLQERLVTMAMGIQ